jgi:hypothetical protein
MSDALAEMGFLIQAAVLDAASWVLDRYIAVLEWIGKRRGI